MQGTLLDDDVGSEIETICVRHISKTERSSPSLSVDSVKPVGRFSHMIQQASAENGPEEKSR